MTNATIYIGDTVTLSVPLATSDGTAFTPGGDYNLIFTAKYNSEDADKDAAFQKLTGAGLSVTGSTASVEVVPADTVNVNPTCLVCDIQAQHLTTGAVSTVAKISLQLIRDITRETTTSITVYTTNPPAPSGGAAVWGSITGTLSEQTDLQNALNAISSSGVPDGDKGDITVSATGATWTIDNGVVTLAKMANLTQDKLIGRSTASTGVPEAITCTAAGRALLDDATAADQRTTLGLGTAAVEAATAFAAASKFIAGAGALTGPASPLTIGTAAGAATTDFAAASHQQAESTITFTDITTGNASASAHGYLPRLENTGSKYLRDDGTWQTVAGGAHDALTIGSTTGALNEVFTLSTQELRAVDATADKLVIWDNTANKLTYSSLPTGVTLSAGALVLGAITPSSVSGVTLTAATTGFTVAGGTTSKTLTVLNTVSLSGTDSSTLNIGTGGTLGTAAYTAATAYASSSSFIAGAGALTGPASPLTIGTAAGATLGTGAGQVPITGDYATAAHNHGAASGTAYDDQSSTNKGNLLKTDSFGSIRVNEAHANNLKMFGNDSRTGHFYVDTVDVQLGASRSYKVPNADGIVALTASTTGIPDKVALAEGNGIALDPSMSADEKWTGLTMDGTAGETLAVGDLCYLDVTATEWKLADADASGTCGPVILGLCILAGNDGAATRMLTYGTMRSAAFPASIALGAPVYVSTTAGDITATAPSGASDFVRIVGYAITAEPNTIFFNPSNTFIELTA